MQRSASGLLIAVEGADGAGTTTQCRRLEAWLNAAGRPAHLTREPSTGPVGVLIREVLGGAHAPFDPSALALLFAADRLDHLAREIVPARARGEIVISDRYLLSSLVYQTLAVPRAFVAEINRFAPEPDLTLLVDVPPEVAAARRRSRGGEAEIFDEDATQRRVIESYREEAARLRAAGHRVVTVDGTPSADAVFAELRAAVAEICGLPPPASSSS